MATLRWSDVRRLLHEPGDPVDSDPSPDAASIGWRLKQGGGLWLLPLAVGIGLASMLCPPLLAIPPLVGLVVVCGWRLSPAFALTAGLLLGSFAGGSVVRSIEPTTAAAALTIALATAIGLLIATLTALLRASLDESTAIAEHDRMTGLVNRSGFVRRLTAEANRSRRSGWPIAIAFLDLDRFKRLNDTRGHAAGDAALKVIARSLAANVRNYDTVARFGGDEFAVLWPVQSAAGAETAGHRLHETLVSAAGDAGFDVGVSLGLAIFETIPDDAADLLARADELMYEAKQSGRGRVVMKHFNDATRGGVTDDRR